MNKITSKNERDGELLRGLLASDTESIREIYRTMLPQISTFLKLQGAREQQVNDLFQEALMALFQRLRKTDFVLTCRLPSYLKSVVRNLWLKQLRDGGREQSLNSDLEQPSLDTSMLDQLERQERESLLWKHFEVLPKGCQQILRWFFAGRPMREIADELDSSEGYIKKRKHQCKQRLVTLVQQDVRFKELQWDQ